MNFKIDFTEELKRIDEIVVQSEKWKSRFNEKGKNCDDLNKLLKEIFSFPFVIDEFGFAI